MNIRWDHFLAHSSDVQNKIAQNLSPLQRKITGVAFVCLAYLATCFLVYYLASRYCSFEGRPIKKLDNQNALKNPINQEVFDPEDLEDREEGNPLDENIQDEFLEDDLNVQIEKRELFGENVNLEEGEIEEQVDVTKAFTDPKSIHLRLKKNFEAAQKQQEEQIPKALKIQMEKDIPIHVFYQSLDSQLFLMNKKSVGKASCQGNRDMMEDEDLASEIEFQVNGSCQKAEIFGIFDGHGGAEASKFVKENLVKYLQGALEQHNSEKLTEEGIWRALKECCIQLDNDYQGKDGTTATLAFVIKDKLYVANVGDSRTILVDKRQAIQLSEDAKPQIERYKKNIEKLGGFVFGNRVNNRLATARAIGDKDMVENGTCVVSPKPKITSYPLKDLTNGYLVLASDGLYDVATTQQVGEAIHQMDAQEMSAEEMAKRLVWSAIACGSRDNVSVLVIKLSV